jgi:hypothetical protein
MNFNREISFGEEIIINRLELKENESFFFSFQGQHNQENFKGIVNYTV